MDTLTSADFWLAVGQIIMIDILLGGDNAVVIALACRNLEKRHQRPAIIIGSGGAIVPGRRLAEGETIDTGEGLLTLRLGSGATVLFPPGSRARRTSASTAAPPTRWPSR